jgi:hypothetical protein
LPGRRSAKAAAFQELVITADAEPAWLATMGLLVMSPARLALRLAPDRAKLTVWAGRTPSPGCC